MLSQEKLQHINQGYLTKYESTKIGNFDSQHYSSNKKLSSTYEYPTEQQFMKSCFIPNIGANKKFENYDKFEFSVFDLRGGIKRDSYQVQTQAQKKMSLSILEEREIEKVGITKKNLDYSYYIVEPLATKKPEPFMGAFLQTQTQLNFFDIHIKIPTLNEVKPFSRILSESIVRETRKQEILFVKQQKDKQQVEIGKFRKRQRSQQQKGREGDFKQQIWIKEKSERQIKQSGQKGKNKKERQMEESLQLQSAISEGQLFPIDDILEVSQIQRVDIADQPQSFGQFLSSFPQKSAQIQQNYKSVIQSRMWQEETHNLFNYSYEFYRGRCEEFINKVEQKTLLSLKSKMYEEQQICSSIVKMIMGIQSDIFILDYHKIQWAFKSASIPVKFSYFLRTSFQQHMQDIFLISNYKGKLQAALKCIKKETYRRILQQVAIEVKNFLVLVQEIALEVEERAGTLLDFIITFSEVKHSITVLYQLLVNESEIERLGKSYMDFDPSYLNSEVVLFRQILRLSNFNDTLVGKGYQLGLKLLQAAFKPITFTLNRIVFQETIEISNRDDTYLRYYFQNLKDLLSYLGKRIELIKQESNELYLICRKKQKIEIVTDSLLVKQYIERWKELFKEKRKRIQYIQQREKRRIKQERVKKQQEKIKQIYQLKAKLHKSIQETKKRKSQMYLDSLKEIERLKKDIVQRQQRRRLTHLIQKEQEKGFLLDAELRQKTKLIQHKQTLLAEAQKIGLNIVSSMIKDNQVQQTIAIVSNEEKVEVEVIKATETPPLIIEQKIALALQQNTLMKSQKENESIEKLPSISFQQKTLSNMSSISFGSLKIQKQSDNQSQISLQVEKNPKQASITENLKHNPEEDNIHISTNTVLEICIDRIIRQQIQITNMAMSLLIYDKYQIFNIMEFMRKVFLNGNGDVSTNFLHLCISKDSRVNIEYFNQCSLFDFADEFIRSLGPEFYQVSSVQKQNEAMRRPSFALYQNRQVNIFQQGLQITIGFQFSKLPTLLEPYFSYIHLSKYMQIFSFILKIKHCEFLISSCLLVLNEHKKQLLENQKDAKFLKRLFSTRHIIQIYLNTLQGYFFYRVIERELKIVRTKLKNKDISELSVVHLNMLDAIIRKGLIQNSLNEISKKIKNSLMDVRKFKNIVDSFCANDIHSYVRKEIQAQVLQMHRTFRDQQTFLQSLLYHP